MKNLFTFLLICIATICVAQDKIPAIITEPGALAPLKGHIQGACCSDDAIYLSHVEGIFKLDWNGKVLKHTVLPKHTGDICYWRGRIYDSLYNDVDGENNIIVLDDDINIIRSYKAPGGGCATVHDGILYVGTGPRDSKPHRFNNITMFTLEDCRPIATMTLDYGVETRYAAQCLASDGKYIYAVFYATNGGAPGMILTPDLKIVKTIRFNGSTGAFQVTATGLDKLLPQGLDGIFTIHEVHLAIWSTQRKKICEAMQLITPNDFLNNWQ